MGAPFHLYDVATEFGEVATVGFLRYAGTRFPCWRPIAIPFLTELQLHVGLFTVGQDVVEQKGAAGSPFVCEGVWSRANRSCRFRWGLLWRERESMSGHIPDNFASSNRHRVCPHGQDLEWASIIEPEFPGLACPLHLEEDEGTGDRTTRRSEATVEVPFVACLCTIERGVRLGDGEVQTADEIVPLLEPCRLLFAAWQRERDVRWRAAQYEL